VHGVGGVLGTVLLGVFADPIVNPSGTTGLLMGNWQFFGKEVLAVALTCVYAFVFTYYMLKAINVFIRVRVLPEEEELGLDVLYHGEIARD